MSSASLNVLLSNNSFLISFMNMETYLLAFPHQLVSSCFWVEFALSPKNCPQMPKWLDGHHGKHLGILESYCSGVSTAQRLARDGGYHNGDVVNHSLVFSTRTFGKIFCLKENNYILGKFKK